MIRSYLIEFGDFDFLGLIERCYFTDIRSPEMVQRRRRLLTALDHAGNMPVQITSDDFHDYATGGEYAVKWATQEAMAIKRWTDDEHRPLWNVLAERWSDLVYAATGREFDTAGDTKAELQAPYIKKLPAYLADPADRIEAAAYTFLDVRNSLPEFVNHRALDALRTVRSLT